MRILFVDDSVAQADAFRRSFTASSYSVVTARNIAEARQAAEQAAFDLVIIDYHLGTELGDACLRELRPHVPEHTRFFLYTTASEAFRRHREMGFDGVLLLKGRSSVRSQVDAIARSIARVREQTGRMNCALDARSDLYSAGVTLYALFASRPPFESDDPVALVHAHLALEAPPLDSLLPALPPILSQVVKKLASMSSPSAASARPSCSSCPRPGSPRLGSRVPREARSVPR
jgi:CheY-like chemotaxis protein